MIYRLRRLNRQWRSFVDTTVEWNALQFTQRDTPGYKRFASFQVAQLRGRFRQLTRRERFSAELKNFHTVLNEPRFPISNLQWNIGENGDPSISTVPIYHQKELDYYATVAMEFC
ncbi:hypothetical protein KC19_VG114700 [Ceratodon purpureus]|uniref:Uncharacterized protein n=1 Tax=Ceratodon purpureus TaxID=3225 RepID=A0A8T0HPD7_CERPU|nr:hypothetical protein KC19_VG114700 [Ceratodon purpureus]